MEDIIEEHDLNNSVPKQEENFIAGIVGAFLFSLVGAIIWFVIYQLGYIAAIAGIITIICAIKGYEVFGKVVSLKGLIASLVVSVVVIFIAEYFCIGYEIYSVFRHEYDLTIFDALRSVGDFLQEEDVRSGFISDLAMGYGFTLLGSFQRIAGAFSAWRNKRNTDAVEL